MLVKRCLKSIISGCLNTVNNPTVIKHIHNEYEYWNEGCNVAFFSNNRHNFPQTVPVIGEELMVTRAALRYTQGYLTPVICYTN